MRFGPAQGTAAGEIQKALPSPRARARAPPSTRRRLVLEPDCSYLRSGSFEDSQVQRELLLIGELFSSPGSSLQGEVTLQKSGARVTDGFVLAAWPPALASHERSPHPARRATERPSRTTSLLGTLAPHTKWSESGILKCESD
jgi:hypothetical protein